MMISAISSASSANFFPAIDAESFRAIPAVESAPVYRSEPAAEFTPSADYLALQSASSAGAEDSAESKTVSSTGEAEPGAAYGNLRAGDLRQRGMHYQLSTLGGGAGEAGGQSGAGNTAAAGMGGAVGAAAESDAIDRFSETDAGSASVLASAMLPPLRAQDPAAATTQDASLAGSPKQTPSGSKELEQIAVSSRERSETSASSATFEVAESAGAEGDASQETASAQHSGETEDADGEDLTEEERKQVEELESRDTEVRQHEQAHLAAAGSYAQGGASYTTQRGPDGQNYAVGGEVSIDLSPESTPQETVGKMQTVQAAALAPAEPSGQDRAVAAEAARIAAEARQEVSQGGANQTAGAAQADAQAEESAPESSAATSVADRPDEGGEPSAPKISSGTLASVRGLDGTSGSPTSSISASGAGGAGAAQPTQNYLQQTALRAYGLAG